MAEAKRSKKLDVDADAMWQRVGGWGSIHEWHPAVSQTAVEQDGKVRRLTLADGANLVESLVGEGDLSYTYRFVESPLPVKGYEATIQVEPDGDGCVIRWEGRFEPDGVEEAEAVALIEGIYQAGLDAL